MIRSSLVENNPTGEEIEASDTSNLWTVTEETPEYSKQPKQEKLRKKKKKSSKRSPLQELMCSDSDGSSHGTRSPEPIPSPFSGLRVGDWEAP